MQNCRALMRGSFNLVTLSNNLVTLSNNLVTLSNNLVTLSEAKGPVNSCIAVTPASVPGSPYTVPLTS